MSRPIPVSFFAVALAASVLASARVARADDAALRYRYYVSKSNAVQASRLAEAKGLLAKPRLNDLKGLTDAKALARLSHAPRTTRSRTGPPPQTLDDVTSVRRNVRALRASSASRSLP